MATVIPPGAPLAKNPMGCMCCLKEPLVLMLIFIWFYGNYSRCVHISPVREMSPDMKEVMQFRWPRHGP